MLGGFVYAIFYFLNSFENSPPFVFLIGVGFVFFAFFAFFAVASSALLGAALGSVFCALAATVGFCAATAAGAAFAVALGAAAGFAAGLFDAVTDADEGFAMLTDTVRETIVLAVAGFAVGCGATAVAVFLGARGLYNPLIMLCTS